MNLKAIVAREGLAILKYLGVGMLVATVAVALGPRADAETVFVVWLIFVVLVAGPLYAVRLLIRFTRWAIRMAKEEKPS